jgi:uncharacterized membrane protein
MTAHIFIIHFPVALIVMGAVVEVLGVSLAAPRLRHMAWILILTGAVASFLAFVTGEGARIAALGPGTLDFERLEHHEQWASVGTWGLIGGALLRTLWRDRTSGWAGMVNLIVALLLAALVVMITLSGTMVRHGG